MPRRADLHTRLAYAVAWVNGRTDHRPAAGVILGSGLGAFADQLARPTVIPYGEIPEFPVSGVAGHVARLVLGELPGPSGPVVVAAMQGRAHVYEGYTAEEVAFGARVLARLGVKLLILTNAAGAVSERLQPGDLVRVTDHLNLAGVNPLTGPNDDRLGPRFPDLSAAYDARLGEVLDACARRLGIPLATGVYGFMQGPSYETPAEVRMLRTLGADVVGMSTVPEVIAARHMGLPVCAISVVSNAAAGLSRAPLRHEDVTAAAGRVRERLGALLSAFLVEAVR
jgi:purine-nucleoside phosphorylase